ETRLDHPLFTTPCRLSFSLFYWDLYPIYGAESGLPPGTAWVLGFRIFNISYHYSGCGAQCESTCHSLYATGSERNPAHFQKKIPVGIFIAHSRHGIGIGSESLPDDLLSDASRDYHWDCLSH